MMLWRLVLSLVVYRHPPSICVLMRGDWHLVHLKDEPYFRWHLWMCTLQANSKESHLARYGALEYVWMMWSAPDSLALRRMLPYMVLGFFVLFGMCCLMSLRRSECRLSSLVCVLVVSWLVVRSCG